MREPDRAADADRVLAAAGHAMAQRAAAVLAPWLADRAAGAARSADLGSAGGVEPGGSRCDAARRAGHDAAHVAVVALRALADTDVDRQRTTPLAVVRRACLAVAIALRDAGVPVPPAAPGDLPGAGDPFGLSPASWSEVDDQLADLALVWGAAKAAAHRARHGR